MEDHEVLAALKDLIQTLEDGKEGFHQASEACKDWEVAKCLAGFSDQRAELSAQLQTLGSTYGDSAYEQESSAAGALHRGWIGLRAAIEGHSAHAMLSECERGEDHAVAEFRRAIEMDLPGNVREVVEMQALQIKTTHDRIRNLRDLAKETGA